MIVVAQPGRTLLSGGEAHSDRCRYLNDSAAHWTARQRPF